MDPSNNTLHTINKRDSLLCIRGCLSMSLNYILCCTLTSQYHVETQQMTFHDLLTYLFCCPVLMQRTADCVKFLETSKCIFSNLLPLWGNWIFFVLRSISDRTPCFVHSVSIFITSFVLFFKLFSNLIIIIILCTSFNIFQLENSNIISWNC